MTTDTAGPLADDPEPVPEFCDEKALASRYGVSGRAIRYMVADGRLPAPFKFGHRTKRWRSAEIRMWEESRRQPARATE